MRHSEVEEHAGTKKTQERGDDARVARTGEREREKERGREEKGIASCRRAEERKKWVTLKVH